MKGIRILSLAIMFTLMTILFTPITAMAGESRAGPNGSIVLLMDADYRFTMSTLEVPALEPAFLGEVGWFYEYTEPVPIGSDQPTTFDNILVTHASAHMNEQLWRRTNAVVVELRKSVESLDQADTNYDTSQSGHNTPKFREVGLSSLLRHTLIPRAVT